MKNNLYNYPELAPLSDEEKFPAKIDTNRDWVTIVPVPDNAPEPDFDHHKYGKPSAIFEFENEQKQLLGYTCRYEFKDSKGKPTKVVLPLTYCFLNETKERQWRFKSWKGVRPLYGLRQLAQKPDKPVIVVEGEKKAKAARKLCSNYVWVTSSGGAKAAGKADWSPLEGREVIIWRDNDKAGLEYQRATYRLLTQVEAKSIAVIDLPTDLPQGWDIGDAIEDGWSEKRINQFIEQHSKLARALPTLTMPELNAHHIPEQRRYLAWLCEGSLVILVAKAGLGKTLFALGISTALANGSGFLKWENELEPVGVLYIDGEMSLHDMRERLRGFIPSMKTKAALEILSHQEFWNIEEADMNLVEEQFQQRIKSYLENRPDIRVVVIDNLSCLFPTLREDKRDDWTTKALPLIIWFRRRNIAVIMVHHTNKQGDQRGSVAKLDAVDLLITLSPLPDIEGSEKAGFFVAFPKHRSVWGDAIAPIEVKLLENDDKSLKWEWRSQNESSEDKLLNLVREGVERVKDAAEMMGLTEGAVSKIKKKLVDRGILKSGSKLVLVEGQYENEEEDD